MGKIKLDKPNIDLNMILYDPNLCDPKKDKWRCVYENCGKEFTSQAAAITHLSKDHFGRNKKGGGINDLKTAY